MGRIVFDVLPYYFGGWRGYGAVAHRACVLHACALADVCSPSPAHGLCASAGNLILIFALTTSPATSSSRTQCFLSLGVCRSERPWL